MLLRNLFFTLTFFFYLTGCAQSVKMDETRAPAANTDQKASEAKKPTPAEPATKPTPPSVAVEKTPETTPTTTTTKKADDDNEAPATEETAPEPEPAPAPKPAPVKPIVYAQTLVPRGIDYATAPTKVAFGSCANQDEPQPLWNVIGKYEPDLFIFGGDVVYSVNDKQKPVSEQFRKLTQIADYKNFREKIPVMAIWDDNDAGQKDAGADNPNKETYKKEFLKHFPYIRDSIGWNQGGLYHVKYIGGDSITTEGRRRRRRKIVKKQPLLQVIVLDTRYYRSPLKKAENPTELRPYEPWDAKDKTKTILGEEQWAWLEEQLERPADLRFIVSSIQVIAQGHGFEKWGNFPAERQRLFDLIKKTGARNTVILSGDRHMGTIAKADIPGFGPLFDITSSSINRPSKLEETDTAYLGSPVTSENFGLALIDWKQKRVRFEIHDGTDTIKNSVEFKF